MAGQIKMTPEELQAKAKLYGSSADQIGTMLSQLSNMQNELRTEWEGRAFERFDEQFNELSIEVKKFAQLMQDIETQLTKTAEAVAQQDEALSQNFGLR